MLRNGIRRFSATPIARRPGFARAQILGTVGNVNFKETREGSKFVQYSLAVGKYDPRAEEENRTEWYSISAFDERHVATFEKVLAPGAVILAHVNISLRQVIDEETGNTRLVTNYKQTSFDIIRWPKKKDAGEGEGEVELDSEVV